MESPIPRLESTNDLSQFPSHSSALQMSDKESVVSLYEFFLVHIHVHISAFFLYFYPTEM